MDNIVNFKPRARLILQLGDQLIRNESMALLELVKNSYDAGANKVTVRMEDIEAPDVGKISIIDDGGGMDLDIVQNVWMQPGCDYKLKQINEIKGRKKYHGRIPIGEKGIGRFGAHKLGFQIRLFTKSKTSAEVQLDINWKDFERDAPLEDVGISIVENIEPKFFKSEESGTAIIITQLKGKWTRASVRELYRSVNSLSSPFDSIDSFRVLFKIDNHSWLKGLPTFDMIKESALYYAEATIVGDEIQELSYQFTPYERMKKVQRRSVHHTHIKMKEPSSGGGRGEDRLKSINLDQVGEDGVSTGVGPIKLKMLIFDRSPKTLSYSNVEKKSFKDYLNSNGGVRVFRGGIRVYDYGEPDNDWLGLGLRRVNQPGKTISNNIVIGAVSIDRTQSPGLIEKTNREGFVENEAYFSFLSAVQFTLDKVLTERNIDKDRIRKFYSPNSPDQPVVGNLEILKNKIVKKIPSGELREELLKSINAIHEDYRVINEIYTRSSSAGLSLSIVIHEIIHMVEELSKAVSIKAKRDDGHIMKLVTMLQRTVGDYAGVMQQSRKTKENLVDVIDQALSSIQFRIQAHGLGINRRYLKRGEINSTIKCTSNLILSSLINIIDNSIWWQNYANISKKEILIDIVEEPKGYVSILIADNGPGFTIPAEEAVKPFMSDKPGGMGLGLHLAHEIMAGQGGRLIFPDVDEVQLPRVFQRGARLLLAFKK